MGKKTIKTAVEPENTVFDKEEQNLRPAVLTDYIGQTKIKEAVGIAINSSKKRNAAMPHTLLYGPPGLGKTTLAEIIANEIGGKMLYLTGATIERPKDIVPTLMQLDTNSVLFIDEIHRMDRTAEEVLYSAMEDNFVSVAIGQGEQTKQIKLTLPPFTLIGATTKAGMLSKPLRDRFGLSCRMEYYSLNELAEISKRTAKIYGLTLSDECAQIVAKCARGTPRIVNRHVVRIRDYAIVKDVDVTEQTVYAALKSFGISKNGLDDTDIKLLKILMEADSPVGIKTLGEILGEDNETLIEVYEPFLLKSGYIEKTPRGRVITNKGKIVLESEDL